jgi:hypothetical protein
MEKNREAVEKHDYKNYISLRNSFFIKLLI